MKAMILAAGLGTRLRPLTNHKPKALVEVGRIPMLQIVIERLYSIGIKQIIINVHHLAEMIEEFLKLHRNFELHIELSYEPEILGTGGGLRKAAWFFNDEAPFLVHNVDVLSEIDFLQMVDFHEKNRALATLAVQNRVTTRPIVSDEADHFCGRQGEDLVRSPAGNTISVAFNGVHVISPTLLSLLTEQAPFSIIDAYVRLAAADGEKILCFDIGDARWWDLGRPDSLAQADKEMKAGRIRPIPS